MTRPCVAFVFARGGSKGVERKNLRLVGGVPLVVLAIQSALESAHVDRVIVSTDDDEIADVGREAGAEVPFVRPKDLASDNAPEWLAWQHALAQVIDVGTFVSVPPTAPLRSPSDIDRCVDALWSSDGDVVICVTRARRSPWFNMVSVDASCYARLLNQSERSFVRRQEVPEAWDITTVAYAARPDFVRTATGLFDGRVMSIRVPADRAVDVDDEFDLVVAEAIVSRSRER
jgi:CMP-N-acetylneuraminic acid synthetase